MPKDGFYNEDWDRECWSPIASTIINYIEYQEIDQMNINQMNI